MAFEKGKEKTGGRKKGTENKDKSKIRQFLCDYLDSNTKKLEDELNKLDGKDYVNAVTGLLEYSIPKLQRSEVDVTTDGEQLNIISLGKGIKPK